MHLYLPKPDVNNYDCLANVNQEELLTFPDFLKDSYFHNLNTPWNPIEVEVSSRGNPSDFPAFVGWQLVFSGRAWRILRPLIQISVNPLPLICPMGEYFGMQVKDIVDCLDYSVAQFNKAASGRLTSVQSYVFKEAYIEAVGNKKIFRLPDSMIILVTQEFKQCVEDNYLKGLIFEEVV